MTRGRMLMVPLALLGGVLMACSDDEEPAEATAAPTATVAATETAVATASATVAATETAEVPEATVVTAVDYAFEGLPAEVEAGTTLALTNASTVELHELVAFRLADDETRTAEELVALPEEEAAAITGGEPAMVLIAMPGAESIAVAGDGTVTEAGRYLVICAIPVGADPEAYMEAAATATGAPEVEGGAPHFTEGMFGEFTVVE